MTKSRDRSTTAEDYLSDRTETVVRVIPNGRILSQTAVLGNGHAHKAGHVLHAGWTVLQALDEDARQYLVGRFVAAI